MIYLFFFKKEKGKKKKKERNEKAIRLIILKKLGEVGVPSIHIYDPRGYYY